MPSPGHKICKQCNQEIAARSNTCPKCQYQFHPSKATQKVKKERILKPKKWIKVFDWQTLVKGDIIKIGQKGGGPYCIKETDEKRLRIPMGERGKFKVSSLDDKGIHCWEHNGSGHAYLQMIRENKTNDFYPNMIFRPYKIWKYNAI